MKIEPTALPDVLLITPSVHGDDRGFFLESWNERRFREAGIDVSFVQDNQSHSLCGVLRGLHYQLRQPQGKLVRVVTGTVFDVAVDLRQGSRSFGRAVGVTLSAQDHRMLWIPPGFAHGFLVLSGSADFLYKCTALHAPDDERAIAWNDPDLAIDWPLPDGRAPTLSARDAAAGSFRDAEYYA